MAKLKLAAVFNNEEENYFKIKVADSRSKKYIMSLNKFLEDLGIKSYLGKQCDECSEKHKDWVGMHQFFRSMKHVVHIVWGEKFIAVLVKCAPKDRQAMVDTLEKHFDF